MKKLFIITLMILSLTVLVNAQDVTVTVDNGTGVFYVRNDGPDTLMVVGGSTGNVGIGTNEPQEKLQIHGDLIVHETAESLRGANLVAADIEGNKVNLFAQDGHGYLKTTTPEMDLHLGAGSWGDHLTIKSDGKVGIGTMSPDEKLHVAGNMRLNGAFEDKDGNPGTAGQILSSTVTGTDWIPSPAGSDDQKVDIFSISGNNVQLSVEDDGEATKTVDISTTTAVTANTAKVTDDDDGIAEVYGAGWNADTDSPTKNDVYDKIETMGGSDDQIFDVATLSGNTLSLSLEDDAEATKTFDISTTTAVTANTAKTTNATHTGEVTGSGTLTIATNAVDGTNIALGSDAQGDVMYYNGTDWVRLAKGTAGQVLEMNAGATAPEWDTDDDAGSDGWHGSTTRIKILPSNFMTAFAGGQTSKFEFNDDGTNKGVANDKAVVDMYAFVIIPTGYKATHVQINGSDTDPYNVYEGNLTDGTFGSSLGSSNVGSPGAVYAITNVESSLTNFLAIHIDTDELADIIYGGYVTITAI